MAGSHPALAHDSLGVRGVWIGPPRHVNDIWVAPGAPRPVYAAILPDYNGVMP